MIRTPSLVVVLVLLTGCGGDPVSHLPDDPDQLIVFSIDGPSYEKNEGALTPEQQKGEVVHGYPVLGKVEVTDRDLRREMIAAVKKSIRSPNDSGRNCFFPRHLVRVIKDGKTFDLMICFQCRNYEAYAGEKERYPSSKGILSSAAQSLLDKVLSDAYVPLASKD
jgi:hypothetical protein